MKKSLGSPLGDTNIYDLAEEEAVKRHKSHYSYAQSNPAKDMDGGLDEPSPEQTSAATKPLTFVVYRTEAKNVVEAHEQSNYLDADQVQFEGVEFWDGTVAIRWRTPTTSMSFWESMEALKRVHIYAHPDYGTRVEWSDGKVEQL